MYRRMAIPGVLLLAMLLSASAQDNKKQKGEMYKRLDQIVEIADAPAKAATASKNCTNYAWAAGVETMLKAQGFPMKHEDLVMKASGGMKCYQNEAWDFAETTKFISGEYVPFPSQKRRVEATWVAGAPRYPDAIIVSLRDGQPVMVVWKGKPYLLYGVLFDAYLTPNTKENIFYIKELRLIDPTVPADKAERKTIFLRESNDPNEIDGVLWVKVTTPE
jgi:hypothetical protein